MEPLDEHVGEDRAQQAVEDDGLREREPEPLDSLQLPGELWLPRDGLDHGAEDVADADAGAQGAEPDSERQSDRLSGLGHVAGGGEDEHRMEHVSLLVFGLDRRADVEGRRRDQHDDPEYVGPEDEDQAEECEDQDVAREHVRKEPHGQRDQAHDLTKHLERDDENQQPFRCIRDPTLDVSHGTVPADTLDVREDEGDERERKRHGEGRGGGVDAPDGKAVPPLSGQRQRNETEQVHDPDEERERCDVREPAADRLGRESLLGDPRLRDLVDRLTDRLTPVREERQAIAHQEPPQQDRESRADQQVDDRFVDREIERSEVDRHPLVQLELPRWIELPARERLLGEGKREEHQERKCALHRVLPKYASIESPSSSVYAIPNVNTAPSARPGREATVANSTTRSAIDLKRSPNACTPEAARLPSLLRARLSRRSSPWTPSQSTAARPHTATSQPASRKTGRASATTSVPASAGKR